MDAVQRVDGDGQPGATVHKVDSLAVEEKAFVDQAKAHLGIVDKPAEDKAAETKQSDTEAKYLKEIARLQKQVREKDGEVKKATPWKDKVQAFDELMDLYKKDKVAALAKLSGRDGLDELADLIAPYWEKKGEKDGKGEGAAAADEMPAWAKALTDDVKALRAENEALKAEKATQATQQTEAQKAAERDGAMKYAKAVVAKATDKFELCARPENVDEAAQLASDGAAVLLQKRVATNLGIKFDEVTAEMTAAEVAKLTPEASDALLLEAYGEVEQAFEALGQRYAKGTQREAKVYNFGPRPVAAPAPKIVSLPEKPTEEEFMAYARAKVFGV